MFCSKFNLRVTCFRKQGVNQENATNKESKYRGRRRDVATRLKYHIASIGLKVVQFGCPIFF